MAADTMKFDKKREVYFTEGGDGPFCPVCWDSDKKQVHLIRQGANNNFHCIIHKIWFAHAAD